MKDPTRNDSDTVEYKPPKRKKLTNELVEYSTREPTWEEQLRLPKRFHEFGPGTWPAARILEEKVEKIGKAKRKYYLVEWEKHPESGERWEPSWKPASDLLGAGLLGDWEVRKHTGNGHSDGADINQPTASVVKPETRRGKAIRRIPDSSSEAGSQQSNRPHRRTASRTSSRPAFSTLKDSSLQDTNKAGRSASSPIEIAETQQDSSQRLSISVAIPPTTIDKSEYESLHSSQINSDGAIRGLFSPTHSQATPSRLSSQLVGSQPSPNRTRTIPLTSSSDQEPVILERGVTPPVTHPSGARPTSRHTSRSLVKPNRPKANGHSSPPSTQKQQDKDAKSPTPYSRPLPRHIPSSSRTSRSSLLVSPQYVSSTNRELAQSRKSSEELGTPVRLTRQRSSQPTNINLDFSSTRTNTHFQPQNGDSSSPWAFESQVPIPSTGGLSLEKPKRRLLKGFLSPKHSRSAIRRTMASYPTRIMSPPGSTSERASLLSAGTVSGSNPIESGQQSSSGDVDASVSAMGSSPSVGSHRRNISEPGLVPSIAPQAPIYDIALGGSALPIQDSIEEEPQSSSGEQSSAESKASSSQQSVENELDIAQVDGLVLPSYPILGPAEYALALPAEGKIQSTYSDIIKSKKKAILKFLNRHESVGSSNGSPNRTQERNEMTELIQLLNDTVTHMDLGLPGISTQYSIQSEQHAAYANYAGSKFSLLGHLVDMLKHVECSIVIMTQAGSIQDLLEHYLKLKHVSVRRQDRLAASAFRSPVPDRAPSEFQVELVSTFSTHSVVFPLKPILMIAFDASFDAQDPQVMRIRQHFSPKPPALLPVVHFIVSNSSEHVDRCLPKDMPSPARLRILVRALYQARPNLGGKPTYVRSPSDEPEGRPMDFADLQRALRKSPERKLAILASIITRASLSQDWDTNWSLGSMPELQLTEMDTLPQRSSGVPTVAATPREPAARSRTPASRSGTPSVRKRLLEVDNVLPALNKRQRLTPTPLRDSVEVGNVENDSSSRLEQLQDLVNKLQAGIQNERDGRQKAEQDAARVRDQLDQWKRDHSSLQRRYEKRMTKCHELEASNKKLLKLIENNKARQEIFTEENGTLKGKVTELQAELTTVREEVKAGVGDAAALEAARGEARGLQAKNQYLDKSLANTRKDFEFTRSQYQEASNKAAEFAGQVRDLEAKVAELTQLAGDEKRRLMEKSHTNSIEKHLAKVQELELGIKTREVLLRKLEEENRQLKRTRGVQTRGSSVQPPGSPGLDQPSRGTRSRQGSPAPGLFPNSHHAGAANRGSLLRHER
ncbi:hypothetical protein LTR41_002815 [Exophiala xenobiotica]|nr:hypothetical protein LTR41_002815 [Exophiala xenobiotica]